LSFSVIKRLFAVVFGPLVLVVFLVESGRSCYIQCFLLLAGAYASGVTDEGRNGMSTITDIFERIAERRGWIRTAQRSKFDDAEAWEHDAGDEAKRNEKKIWNDIMKQLHCSFEVVSKAMDEGLEHAGLLLEFIKPPKKNRASAPDVDVEAKGGVMKPGDKGFSDYLEKRLADFYSKRGQTLKTWARGRGLSAEQWDAAQPPGIDDSEATPDENRHRRDQQQLYLILYMEFLVRLPLHAIR
jgi:hypothetical protein